MELLSSEEHFKGAPNDMVHIFHITFMSIYPRAVEHRPSVIVHSNSEKSFLNTLLPVTLTNLFPEKTVVEY